MYVTRRLLRSTLSDASSSSSKSKSKDKGKSTPSKTACKTDAPFLPPPTPKRRAAVRASAKICAVIADASGPAARSRSSDSASPATSKKARSDAAESHRAGKNHRKKTKSTVEAVTPAVAQLHGFERLVDVRYLKGEYAEARILNLDASQRRVFVHYMGWNARYDAWVPLQDVAAHGTHSGAAHKSAGWTGKRSLFSPANEKLANSEEEPKPAENMTVELESGAKKSKKRSASRSRSRSTASGRKRGGQQVRRASGAQEDQNEPQNEASRSIRRSSRRVQVAVGTTDEASEGHEMTEPADLVLDVEIQGQQSFENASDVGDVSAEAGDALLSRPRRSADKEGMNTTTAKKAGAGEAKRKRNAGKHGVSTAKKAKKTTVKAAVQTSSGRALGASAREKLSAIFRLRVQQRQQLEQLQGGQGSSFQQQLMQDQVPACPTRSSDSSMGSAALANEAAGMDEYQLQLQQYYYQQQVLLTSSLASGMNVNEDPSTLPLQGGMIDPRVIQERLTTMEERRRQQMQIQAYYRQLLLTRERNVRALAANQAFVSGSAAAWQQQMKASQDEGASVTSWKDVTESLGATDKESGSAGTESPSAEALAGDKSKESETSAPVTATSGYAGEEESGSVSSPDSAEKGVEGDGAGDATRKKEASAAGDPAETGTGNGNSILYEFVL